MIVGNKLKKYTICGDFFIAQNILKRKVCYHRKHAKRSENEISSENLCGKRGIKMVRLMIPNICVRMSLAVSMNFILTVSY